MAGIGAAISLIFVVLAYFVKNLSLTFYVLSSIGVMFPLTKKYFREGILTSIAVSVAGFFIVNTAIVPFVMASGFYVVLTVFLHEKKFNRWLGYLLKLLYAGLVFFICYKLLTLITVDISSLPRMAELSDAALYAIFNIIFAACFIVYDILLEQGYIYLTRLLSKIVKSR